MKEYEYSFVVDSADRYHAFCKNEHPLSIETIFMHRRIFKNGSSTIARLTEELSKDGATHQYFDFKEDSDDSLLIKHVQEMIPVTLDKEKTDYYLSFLEVLGFHLDADLIKKRTRYQFTDLYVDIDEYTSPRKAIVIELEGEQQAVDSLYKRITH